VRVINTEGNDLSDIAARLKEAGRKSPEDDED